MEVPASVPQWMINLAVVASFIITAIGGLIYQNREKKAVKPDPGAGTVAVLGGTLASERLMDRLIEALGHNERTVRDAERATINNTNEVSRARDEMVEIRQLLAARNDHFETDAARLLAAIEASRGKKG